MPPDLPKGTIAVWSGAIADIPIMWHLCDGNRDTPDLRNRFIPAAGTTYNPADRGGTLAHTHTATTDGHFHTVAGGTVIKSGLGALGLQTSTDTDTFTSDPPSQPLPFYALCYIMYLKARR